MPRQDPRKSTTTATAAPQAASSVSKSRKPSNYKTKANGRKATGQPEKYRDDFPRRAQEACALGATDEQLASILGISVPTLYKYERDYDEFFKAINKGKDYFDNKRVKASVRDRALGYNWEERSEERTEIEVAKVVKTESGHVVEVRDEKGRKIMVRVPATKTKVTNRHVPADPACAFFWLTNRNRVDWQHIRVNKVEGKLDVNNTETKTFDFSDVDVAELESLYNTLGDALVKRMDANSDKSTNGSGKAGPSGTA